MTALAISVEELCRSHGLDVPHLPILSNISLRLGDTEKHTLEWWVDFQTKQVFLSSLHTTNVPPVGSLKKLSYLPPTGAVQWIFSCCFCQKLSEKDFHVWPTLSRQSSPRMCDVINFGDWRHIIWQLSRPKCKQSACTGAWFDSMVTDWQMSGIREVQSDWVGRGLLW